MVSLTLRVSVQRAVACGACLALVVLVACGSFRGPGRNTVAAVRSVLDGRRAALLLELDLPGLAGREADAPADHEPTPCRERAASLAGIVIDIDRAAAGDEEEEDDAEERRTRFAGSVVRLTRLLEEGRLFTGPLVVGLEGARKGRELLDRDDAALLLLAPLSEEGEDAARELLEAMAALPSRRVRRDEDRSETVVFGGDPGDKVVGMAGVRDGTFRLAVASPVLRREVPRLFDGRPPEVSCDLSLPGKPLPAKVTRPAWRLVARPRRASAILATALASLGTERVLTNVLVRAAAGEEILPSVLALPSFGREVLHGVDRVEARSVEGELEGRVIPARTPTPLVRLFHESSESLAAAAFTRLPRWTVEAYAAALPRGSRLLAAVPFEARPAVVSTLLPGTPATVASGLVPRIAGPWTTWWAPREAHGRFMLLAGATAGLAEPDAVDSFVQDEIAAGRLVSAGEIGDVRLLRSTIPRGPVLPVKLPGYTRGEEVHVQVRPLSLPGRDRPRWFLGLGNGRAFVGSGGRRAIEEMLGGRRGGEEVLREAWERLARGEPVVGAVYRDPDLLARVLVRAVTVAAAAGNRVLAEGLGTVARCRAARLRAWGGARELVLVTRTPEGFAFRGAVLGPGGGKGE